MDNKDIDEIIFEGSNDDKGASNLVIMKFNDKLHICQNELYVFNHRRVRTSNEKEVNRISSNTIVSLNIKFYGADGVRKYSYSNAYKNQQNCIQVLKNNLHIKVDDDFLS